MGIIFPLGLALFQAANMRLHAYSTRQRFLVHGNPGAIINVSFSRSQVTVRWKRLDALQKTYLAILLAFVIQVIVTTIVYFGSFRFHASYGIFSHHVNPTECRRGFEWIPTVVWQALWTFFVGPYVLFRTRSIHDTHYWALQTRLTIGMSIIGTPMWLAFVYSDSPAVIRLNRYVPTAFWFLPGLWALQLTSIILPLWDAHRERILFKRFSLDNQGLNSTDSLNEKQRSMAALDIALAKNIEPLLQWAARREFTAENIVFLKAVRDFRRKWRAVANIGTNHDTLLLELFEDAAYIYFSCVDRATAAFNINVDSQIYNKLKDTFRDVRISNRALDSPTSDHSEVCPFDDLKPFVMEMGGKGSRVRPDAYALPTTDIESKLPGQQTMVPEGFNIHIFDDAYKSVKYLVFTNTWQRYLDHSETSSRSSFSDPETTYFEYQTKR
ncbi:MAG: hypothetical protein M1821_010005 [Bathelium mastoideum]|nr:MAG: hypothetical protein M1821_010005 [Bathelium mastoideum]